MPIFRDISIKRKLTLIIMLTSTFALLLACMAFVMYDLIAFRHAMARELSILAEIIGANSTAALSFDHQRAAEEILAALSAEQHIVSACIYAQDGRVFAKYHRGEVNKGFSPPGLREDGHYFGDDHLVLFQRIMLKDEKIGTVYIQADIQELYSRLKRYVGIGAILMLASSFLAFLLSSKLQQVVSKPILLLAQTARVVSVEKNYSVRATKHSQDEVGLLIEAFNEMLTQIQERDTALQEARDSLEERVKERTEELEEVNQQLKQNQAQLVQSEKMAGLGLLAAGVAHEINNPVGYVMSNLGILTEYVEIFKQLLIKYNILAEAVQAGNGTDQQETLDRIEEIRQEEDLDYLLEDVDQLLSESAEGTQRVKEIVEGLRNFARVDETDLKEADINEGIESTLKVIWNELKYKCEIHKQLGEIPPIRCYPRQLNQVFMNLLVNAAQAIPERGEIQIETEATDTHIVIRISDTGIGIPLEDISKLFDPFFTTKQVGKGTGLGLSISHGIIQKHKGTIEVESEVGKGTMFTIRLPIEEESDE